MTDKPDGLGLTADLILRPEWTVLESHDKSFVAGVVDAATGVSVTVAYVVPAGKTLYITQFSWRSKGNLVADRDNNHMCDGIILDVTSASYYWYQGSNAGGAAHLVKPISIPSAHTVNFDCTNLANHNCDLVVFAAGYEL